METNRTNLGIYISKEIITQIEELVHKEYYRNKSHAVEEILKKGIKSIEWFGK